MTTPDDARAARLHTATERWLVTLAREGDTEAFATLYDRYHRQVFAFVRHRVRNTALAEDFTSETFLRALRRIGTFSCQGRAFGAWLMVIARNIVIDHYKSSPVRREVFPGAVVDSDAYERAVEEQVIEAHAHAALWAAVGRLSPLQQECVTLRFRRGMSVAETARIMGKREGAVKTLTHRAVRSLARSLPAGHPVVAA
ncbi:sigma-70 family RNA polymerase sigma factor [Streptomyces xinghaiensis]|uniref:sigma-70 family RNA polymerase sigma factor n=1 Tax=Streptomyces xinghaiensis TaxID=1038928 RepID=UPI000BB035C8